MTQTDTALVTWELDPKELDIYRKHYAPASTTDEEWEIFLETCRAYRVSPIRRQIYLVGRYDSQKKRMVNTPQVSIGTLRLMALRTHQFEGTTEPEWGDEEGNWYKLWPKRFGPHPYAARIGVYRRGFRSPVWGVAYFHEMAQKKKEGGLTKFWLEMGIHMVIKCALADALRGAFEEECGGIYIHEEMNQADSDMTVVSIVPEVTSDEDNDALHDTASNKAPVNAPKVQVLYQRGKEKGLWVNTQGFCAFVSAELGFVVGNHTLFTTEQRLQVDKAISEEKPIAQAS